MKMSNSTDAVLSNKDICRRSSKKDTVDREKKEQGMGVGWCNEFLNSNTVEKTLTSSAKTLSPFLFQSKGFDSSFTCMKTIVKSHQMLII